MKMFGVLDLDTGMHGCRFSIGIRNATTRACAWPLTVGYRVFVCENMAFSGDFQPVLAKHSKNFSLQNALSIGVDQMQRNFDGMRKQVESWRESQLSDVAAKLIIYRAFIESDLEVPKHLARPVHDLYFNPQYDEFQPRTLWSLSNAFTSAFKELEPIPQFRATAKLAGFLESARSSGRRRSLKYSAHHPYWAEFFLYFCDEKLFRINLPNVGVKGSLSGRVSTPLGQNRSCALSRRRAHSLTDQAVQAAPLCASGYGVRPADSAIGRQYISEYPVRSKIPE